MLIISRRDIPGVEVFTRDKWGKGHVCGHGPGRFGGGGGETGKSGNGGQRTLGNGLSKRS